MQRRNIRRAIPGLVLVALSAASFVGVGPNVSGASAATAVGTSGKKTELFDASVIHSIEVKFDQADYDAMIDAYADSGEKTWIKATVTVDGRTYKRAGLRLKGNSSLMGLGGRGPNAGGGGPPGLGGAGLGGAGLGGGSAETPELLPWLVRLDEFVPDQLHQGYADIVIRSNNTKTALNEAVALDLLDAAELASQQAISTTFSVNGGEPVLRLAVEHPGDDAWQDRVFASKGALYKAESTGDWSYRGDDPASYSEVFDQEGGKKVADLSPLIELLQFINEADDQTFAEELPDRLDVESFATYLAMMELLENFDDIDGPGNNAYLWWDEKSEQFTVVPWDMNLAFGSFPGGGGGGGPPGGFDPGQLPEGAGPPGGFDPPQGGGAGPQGGPQGGPSFGRGNILVQRFHANAAFEELYQEQLSSLRADLFASGTADTTLDRWVATLNDRQKIVDAAAIEEEAETLSQRFEAIAGEAS